MRILMTIHHHLDMNSGAAGSTMHLAHEYEKLGHHVEIFSYDDLPKSLGRVGTQLFFPFYVARHLYRKRGLVSMDVIDASTGDACLYAKLRKGLRENQVSLPALITRSTGLEHTHQIHMREEESLSMRNARQILKRPLSLCREKVQLGAVAHSLRGSDLCMFLNRVDQDYAVKYLSVGMERAHVVGNGIPEEYLGLPFHEKSSLEGAQLNIAVLGSFIFRKGIRYSTSALNTLLNRFPEMKASFLGTGCDEKAVHAMFDAQLRSRVFVLPYYKHTELPSLLTKHQIQIFASVSEGFGKTLLEGMACGLAPITTNTPGPLEIVKDGHDGLVVPKRDSQTIVEAVEKLAGDFTLLRSLRHNAYNTAQQFSWADIAQKRLSLYEKALSRI